MFKKAALYILFFSIVASNSFGDTAYKNFTAQYNFEFSSMIIAKGTLKGRTLDNNTYKISFHGRTTPLISVIFKLIEQIEGAVSIKTKRDIYYRSYEETPKKKKYIYVDFSGTKIANVTIIKNNKEKNCTLKSNSGINSPISLYLFFITNKFTINKTYYRYVAVSSHLYKIAIKPVKYTTKNIDRLSRKSGIKDAIEVELRFYKVDKNGKDIPDKNVKKVIAWIAKDKPNIPIMVESWHLIGNFMARLTKLEYK